MNVCNNVCMPVYVCMYIVTSTPCSRWMNTEKRLGRDVRFVRIARPPLQLQAVPAPRVLHLRLHRRERAALHDADPGGPEGGRDGHILEWDGSRWCWCWCRHGGALRPEPESTRVLGRCMSRRAVRWFHPVDLTASYSLKVREET